MDRNFITFCMAILSWMSLLPLSAQKVTKEEALTKAMIFLQGHNHSNTNVRKAPRRTPQLVLANNRDELFVFNDKANGGYVIVSGDERTPDVLGYSDYGYYDAKNAPCNMQAVLDAYAEQVSYLRTHPDYKMPVIKKSEETKVAPLLGETAWNQLWPYNEMCPMIDGEHCPTGCVATAAAQVMYYHKWPERGKGSNSYEWNGQTLSADFSQSVYRWDLMTPTYDSNSSQESCDAVALLMRDVGFAVNMNYNLGGSGASTVWPLTCYFDYDESMCFVSRNYCDAESFHNFIMDDLLNGLPVLYDGGDSEGGDPHALIIDGYDGNGYYHFNFGWGGGYNGNYTILSVRYNSSPGITFGIKKNEGGKKRLFLGLHDDFIYIPEEDIIKCDIPSVGVDYSDLPEPRCIAVAIENVNSHEIIYLDWYNQLKLSISLPDGDYILYPVYQTSFENSWRKYIFYDDRQSYIDLNVTNGIKSYTNNHLSDPIQDGAILIDNIYYYLDDNSHEATVTFKNDRYASYSGDVTIPTIVEYNGQKYDVTEIGNSAFLGSNIGILKVANTIKTINSAAFNTVNVDRIIFEKDSKLEKIGGFAFQACDIKSGQLDLPEGLKCTENRAFYGTFVPWISLPRTVTNQFVFDSTVLRSLSVHWDTSPTLQANTFSGVDLGLCTLYVPKGTIDQYCQADTWKEFGHIIEMGDTITIDDIKYMLFEKDHSATLMSAFDMKKKSFSIPSVITHQGKYYAVNGISPYAFANCPMKEVTIPSSVKYIGGNAFQNYFYSYINSLKLCHINPPFTEGMLLESYNPSSGVFKDIVLYVPVGCKSKYESDSFWGQFKTIIEDKKLGEESSPDFAKYDLNGDGKTDADDIVVLRSFLLGSVLPGFDEVVADVNGDSKVNIADIVALINLLLSANTQTLIAEKDWTGGFEGDYPMWAQFADGQEGFVASDAEGVAINVGTQTGEFWQPQVIVLNEGLSLVKDHDYVVKVIAKFPTDGTLQINMGTWDDRDEHTTDVIATGDFQEVEVAFDGYTYNVDDNGFVLFQCGDFDGTTIVKKVQVYETSEGGK